MKLDQFWQVEALASARRKLVVAHTAAVACGIGVTIGGTYQDEDVVAAASPAVAAVFAQRIADLDAQLLALGVEVE